MAHSNTGSCNVHGADVDHVLRVSTRHMPSLDQDLSPWHWGHEAGLGVCWIYAYDESCSSSEQPIPDWLLNICILARDKYNCNWILLDPDATPLPDVPTYEHP